MTPNLRIGAIMCVVCEARMTLFHHLKLKRPRINSAPNGQMDESLDNAPSSESSPTEDPMVASDPSTDPAPSTHSEDDPDGMPQLERQNSVFDGGGGALPQLTPQHWPLSNTLAYRRHFSPSPPPPPLLMGERTMVWTVKGRAPPSSTVTSSPKRSPPETPSNSQQNTEVVSYHPTSSLARESISTTDEETSSTVSSVYPSWQDTQQQSPDTQALNLSVPSTSRGPRGEEEDGQPMICMICEDRATGLHYGIITCEGCKGFFKRTVQNKRVYSCVSDGNCEVTKAQRNRCQYCRFQKCVRQGMVLAAVREDRMPGGRNSGAVYNLYKVKYKKHRRGQRNGHATPQEQQQNPPPPQPQPQPASAPTTCFVNPSEWSNGQILKAALTRPPITAGRMGAEQALQMIRPLVECDAFEEVARLRNARELLQCKLELNDKLCHIGDTIVYKLVQWTKRLPFYDELPVALHTQLLTHKWHELLVLTTCAFLAMRSVAGVAQTVSSALASLKECLTVMVGEPVGLEELQEAGPLVERLARLADTFRRIGICMEEYVCLKVIIMQSADDIKDQKELEAIHDRYLQALQVFVGHRFPQQTTRFSDLLACIPEVQATASLVVQSKMFYVPLFLNTSLNKNDS